MRFASQKTGLPRFRQSQQQLRSVCYRCGIIPEPPVRGAARKGGPYRDPNQGRPLDDNSSSGARELQPESPQTSTVAPRFSTRGGRIEVSGNVGL